MKLIRKWIKYTAFAVAVVVLLTASGPAMITNAASDAINVTNALTGAKVYSGNDLQEAFDASERGCVVTVGRYITLTKDVVLRAEVMLNGYSFIKFVPDVNNSDVYYRFLLAEKGAIFVDTRIRTKYIAALHKYSSIDMIQENGGYAYYLLSEAPDFAGSQPQITVGKDILGAKVDAKARLIYVDISPKGITQSAMAQGVSMKAENTEKVTFTFQAAQSGGNAVATGGTMVATATNYDYDGKTTASYGLIVLGDVNSNGLVEAADAALVAQFATGARTLSDKAMLAADVNMDGLVNAKDAQAICEKCVRAGSYKSPLQA